jgi:hypothetical protein
VLNEIVYVSRRGPAIREAHRFRYPSTIAADRTEQSLFMHSSPPNMALY